MPKRSDVGASAPPSPGAVCSFNRKFALLAWSLVAMIGLSFLQPAFCQTLDLEKRVITHTLKNGMRVLILPRKTSPTVALQIHFKVGSVDEKLLGGSGVAHFLEHLLFKGTKTIGSRDYAREKTFLDQIDRVAEELDLERMKGTRGNSTRIERLQAQLKSLQEQAAAFVVKDEMDQLYSRNGGVGFNAFTSHDATNYVLQLPANRLELWMAIESDRMANPVLREFYSERDVIIEERRMRTDSDPNGKLSEQFLAAAFLAHPYRIPVIGWLTDMHFLDKKTTEDFRRTYYSPNNTVVALVGDVDPQKTISLMERYFGPIPPQVIPPRVHTQEPEQLGERRVRVDFDATPQLRIGWHKPNMPAREDYVFDIISSLLARGRTSRLYKALVEKLKVADWVSSYMYPGDRYENLFVIAAAPAAKHTNEDVEQAIYQEIERLQKERISQRELQKIQNRVEADFIKSLDDNSQLADILTYDEALVGDWRYFLKYAEVVRSITPDEIQRVAQRYLIPSNRTVALLVSKPAK